MEKNNKTGHNKFTKKSGSGFFIKSNNKKKQVFKSKDESIGDDKSKKTPKNGQLVPKDHHKTNKMSIENDANSIKKPFDKKTYRLKKYSNKYKLDQWEDNRKKAVLRNYFRDTKDNENENSYVKKIYEESTDNASTSDPSTTNASTNIKEQNIPTKNDVIVKKKGFQRVQETFNKWKEEKQQKKEEFLKVKAEKEKAIKKYRKEKAFKFRKLSRKTKKGQPIMKDRLEMLLEKIQKSG